MNIAVYCSAREGIPEVYFDDARQLGTWIGANGHALVYGGLSYALMEAVAQAARQAGARVVGVVPEQRRDRASEANTVRIEVSTLHERKAVMEENAEVFVALEGGIGTLDEIFSVLASQMFEGRRQPIILLDRDGIYTPLIEALRKLQSRGLCNAGAIARLQLVPDIETLIATLSAL